jgi:RNA polymerase sigma-70 factor, ECF subfamily
MSERPDLDTLEPASHLPSPKPCADLMPEIYAGLRSIAERYLSRERPDHTLQPTALVHEAFLRLAGTNHRYLDAPHLLATAATAMRNILVDHARNRGASKRGRRDAGAEPTDRLDPASERGQQVLELDDLLEKLAEIDERKAKVVELRFFGGMTLDQIAAALGAARSTIADDWSVARAWLASRIVGGEPVA